MREPSNINSLPGSSPLPAARAEVSWVSGPIVRATGGQALSMYEVVEVGEDRLIG